MYHCTYLFSEHTISFLKTLVKFEESEMPNETLIYQHCTITNNVLICPRL
jgi:hypothetical protein